MSTTTNERDGSILWYLTLLCYAYILRNGLLSNKGTKTIRTRAEKFLKPDIFTRFNQMEEF